MMWCSECGRGEGGERAGGEGEERGGWGERGEGRVRRGECVGRGESGERRGWGERERRVGRGEGGDEYMCMCDHSPSISTSLTPPLIHPTPHSPHPSLTPPLTHPTHHSPHPSPVYSLAAFMWSLHYTKRLLETTLVHRFSHATMPIRNLFKVSL